MDTTQHGSPDTASATHSGGMLLLRRILAAIFIPLGAILLALAAGAALNPPTTDSTTFTITATNVGAKPINSVSVHDRALDGLGGTLTCPATSLGPGEQVSCSAEITGKADSAHLARMTSGALVGTASLTMGILVLRFPKPPSVKQTLPAG